MDILPDPLAFDWDHSNIDKNLKKHDVTRQEAEEMFLSEPLIIARDREHSKRERRMFALGKTRAGRKLFAAFTIRNNKLRVISVRDMTQAEEDAYENFEENS